MIERRLVAWLEAALLGLVLALGPTAGQAQPAPDAEMADDGMVQLDFNDVELNVVIDTIARLTNRNFIYDDRVRGRVTIVSPTRIPIEQAYTVFQSVLNVKGFTTVDGPGGAIKIVPVRDAKESAINTVPAPRPTPESDTYVTRLIPLQYIDADAISNSLKPLVSKDAALLSYPPTNTIILTDSASNILRILEIIQAIDIETFKEELVLLKVEHADAATLAQQIADIYGGEVSATGGGPSALRSARVRTQPQVPGVPTPGIPGATGEAQRDRVRIITDQRTNSLIILSSRTRIEDIRRLVAKLDVPVTGGGRIHVYYLKNADAEELAETLNSVISGQPAGGGATGGAPTGGVAPVQAQALRAAITELAEGVSITADKATNSLIIQASQEGYATIRQVIEKLDVRRPQVLVEALIMEVTISDNSQLGLNGVYRTVGDGRDIAVASLTDSARPSVFGTSSTSGTTTTNTTPGQLNDSFLDNLIVAAAKNSLRFGAAGPAGALVATGGSLIQGILRASANLNNANVLSAPHILTTDNEEAEIKVGNNIPIISSRVQSAAGVTNATGDLATSVNVERQDIGITLRVTPQISEGNSLRLKIFQEITNINRALIADTGDPNQVGVPLSNRKVENNVIVADGETVVIGGLLDNQQSDNENKVPWAGDIPFFGWAFKTVTDRISKTNLLVFLTPHIVRTAEDLEKESIRKRNEFRRASEEAIAKTDRELEEEERAREKAEALGVPYEEPESTGNALRDTLRQMARQYPLERMSEIEAEQREQAEEAAAAVDAGAGASFGVLAAIYRSEDAARAQLTELVDAGYDGTLVSNQSGGGAVFYELRLGPFPSSDEANRVAETVRRAYGLSPTVIETEGDRP